MAASAFRGDSWHRPFLRGSTAHGISFVGSLRGASYLLLAPSSSTFLCRILDALRNMDLACPLRFLQRSADPKSSDTGSTLKVVVDSNIAWGAGHRKFAGGSCNPYFRL